MQIFQKFIIILLLLVTSCQSYTKKLWQPRSYEEVFQYFIISNNGNFITFLGDEFHYVFLDKNGTLKRVLSFENRDELVINTEQTRIEANKNNNLEGKIIIETLSLDLSDNQTKYLRGIGFKKKTENYQLEAEISGTRYVNNVQFRGNFSKLSVPYRVKIIQKTQLNPAKIAVKSTLTPFAIVADIVFGTLGILVFPFSD